ncbi:hypothetical protein [Paenibacillus agricola]|uniref:Transmembrane protein n=1 Tax=Paenibacillus agricola TaxID=2716264 RepID=A0ABX0JLZ0_9BACL|nr:hypothetical protein [Paenibacillus agricola]NHN35306.1 hypothetical protein [Paenibacillus agricola]
MKRCLYFLTLILCINMSTVLANDTMDFTVQVQDQNKDQIEPYSRGSFRSPSGSFSGGSRAAPRGGYNTGPRAPSPNVTRNPRTQPGQQANPTSRWGGLFGGIAAGAIIGSLLHPFGGYGYGGGGFSLIGILFWVVIIYVGYKLFQKFREKNR